MELDAPVSMLMSSDDLTVGSIDQTLREVWSMMTLADVQHIPIVDGAELIGLITSWDVARLAMDHTPEELAKLKVDGGMERCLVRLHPRATLQEAASVLAEGGFHSLPVADDNGSLVGIITSTDVMRFVATGRLRI